MREGSEFILKYLGFKIKFLKNALSEVFHSFLEVK